jgi:ELWxxDGT repeat protein
MLGTCENAAAQTRLKADVYHGKGSSFPADLTSFGTALLFNAMDTTNGFELQSWEASDTLIMLQDIQPGKEGAFPYALTDAMGQLYFSANDGTNGHELWMFNGITAAMVADITNDSTSSWPDNFTEWGTSLYFAASDSAHGSELWQWSAGVVSRLTDIYPDTNDAMPNHLTVFSGKLIFTATDSAHGNEIWQYNGSTASLLMDLYPGASGSYANGFTAYNGELYFSATDGNTGHELWKYDGATVSLVSDIFVGPQSSYPAYLTVYNGNLIFSAQDSISGNEVRKYDGSNLSLVAEVNPGPGHAYPADFVLYDSALFFSANDGLNGFELWKTDAMSTVEPVVDIYKGAVSSCPVNLTPFNGELYFRTSGEEKGTELWSYRPCKLPESPLIIASDTLVCLGTEVHLSIANADSLGGASYWVLYQHSLDSTAIDTSLTGIFSVHPADTAAYYFVRGLGCDVPGVADSIQLRTFPVYTDSIDVSICAGDTFVLDTQLLTLSGMYTAVMEASDSCDSVVVVHLQVNPTLQDTFAVSICEGDSFLVNGLAHTTSGTYTEAHSSVDGCDSIAVYIVTVHPTYADSISIAICSGEQYSLGGQLLDSTGQYTEIFQTVRGCDSLVFLDLMVFPSYQNDTIFVDRCMGQTYTFGSQTLSASGWYSETYSTANGCDSIVTLRLNVWPSYNDTLAVTICEGESYAFGPQLLTLAGVYSQPGQTTHFCDSNQTILLTVLPTYLDTLSVSICQGQSYVFGAQVLTVAGTYNDTLQTLAGCDSTVVLRLSVLPVFLSDTVFVDLCAGETYRLGSQIISTSGWFTEVFQSALSCDSILTAHVKVWPSYDDTVNVTICEGEGYVLGPQALTTSGVYSQLGQTSRSCDSNQTVILTVLPVYHDTLPVSICQGQSYVFGTQSLTLPGNYADTLQTSGGCDSIVTLVLEVKTTFQDVDTVNVCAGEVYNFGSATLSASGDYTAVFTAQNGCDSTVFLHFIVQPLYTQTIIDTICAGESYAFNAQLLTVSGTYTHTMQSATACDSSETLYLTVLPAYNDTLNVTLCAGESYLLGAQLLDTTGTYTAALTTAFGCDSIVTVNLNVLPTYSTAISATICGGESYVLGNQNLSSTGNYSTVFTASNGCDSTVNLSLTVWPTQLGYDTVSICAGEQFVFGSQTLTSTGNYVAVFQNTYGCDSTVQLSLLAHPTYSQGITAVICMGDVYVLGTQTLAAGGTYTEVFQTTAGCDSVVNLSLTVHPTYHDNITASICAGETYQFGSQLLTTPGLYSITFQSANGCDSVVNLNLLQYPTYLHNTQAVICSGESYLFGGVLLTNSGTYQQVLQTVYGCDSTIILALTVHSSYQHTDTVVVCSGQPYAFGSTFLTASGDYTETFTTANGCDSIVQLHFVVNPAYSLTDTVAICFGMSYSFGSTVLNSTGDYVYNFQTANGCDSIVALHLEVNPVYGHFDTLSICMGQQYVFGSQTLTFPGTYVENFYTAKGCDSIVTLSFNVNPVYYAEDTVLLCQGQTYQFGSHTLSTAGSYTQTFSTVHFCDSTIKLEVIHVPTTYDTLFTSICSGETYVFAGLPLTSSGTYYDTLSNAVGCDSIQVLQLVVYPLFNEKVEAKICAGTIYPFGGRVLDSTGIYYATFQSQHGCDSNVTLRLIAKKIDATVNQQGNKMIANNESATYQWYRMESGWVLIAGATEQTLIASLNGVYRLKVTEGFCSNFSDSLHVKTVGIGLLPDENTLRIFPNPSEGRFYLALDHQQGSAELQVYGPSGQVVHQEKFQTGQTYLLNLEHLAEGMYVVQVLYRSTQYIEKLIIH